MIGYLRGIPRIFSNQLLVEVNGVGYLVNVGLTVFSRIHDDQTIELFIHTHVKEDDISLYGFLSETELVIFKQLLSVSGVGPKTALLIAEKGLSNISKAIQEADVAFFTQIPRVGKKLAQKIIIDLRSKLGSLKDLDLRPESQRYSDVAQALESLGYNANDIQKVLQEVEVENLPLQDVIKAAMRKIHK